MVKQLFVAELNGSKKMIAVSFWKYLKLRLAGYAFYEYRWEEGWRNALSIYLSVCKKHGYYLAHLSGFGEELCCLKCFDEKVSKTLGAKV
jgi:hypothetical protein